MNLFTKTSLPYNADYGTEDFHSDNILFNCLGGTYEPLRSAWDSPIDKAVVKAKIKLYLNLLKEEVQEGLDALEAENIAEILDAAIDVQVVNDGLLSILQVSGADADYASYKTAKNNLSKFPLVQQSSDTIREDTVAMYSEQCIEVDTTLSGEGIEARYVFKNKATGKILKPFGFERNNLSDCIIEDDLKNLFKSAEAIQDEQGKE